MSDKYKGTLHFGGPYRPTIDLYGQNFLLNEDLFVLVRAEVTVEPTEETIPGRYRAEVFLEEGLVFRIAQSCQDSSLVPFR